MTVACHNVIDINKRHEKCINSLQSNPTSLHRVNAISIVTFIVASALLCHLLTNMNERDHLTLSITLIIWLLLTEETGGRTCAIIHGSEKGLNHDVPLKNRIRSSSFSNVFKGSLLFQFTKLSPFNM